MNCPDCKIKMVPVKERPRWFICPKCSYEAKRKPTRKECERLAKILGVTSDLKSGRYKMSVKDVFTTELDCVAEPNCKSTTPNVKKI